MTLCTLHRSPQVFLQRQSNYEHCIISYIVKRQRVISVFLIYNNLKIINAFLARALSYQGSHSWVYMQCIELHSRF